MPKRIRWFKFRSLWTSRWESKITSLIKQPLKKLKSWSVASLMNWLDFIITQHVKCPDIGDFLPLVISYTSSFYTLGHATCCHAFTIETLRVSLYILNTHTCLFKNLIKWSFKFKAKSKQYQCQHIYVSQIQNIKSFHLKIKGMDLSLFLNWNDFKNTPAWVCFTLWEQPLH